MARKPQASLCQATWPVGCERISLLDGCNTTCKALEISDIIKGIRGKREFKGFKAIVNSLKTTQGLRESARSTGRVEDIPRGRLCRLKAQLPAGKVESCTFMAHQTSWIQSPAFHAGARGFKSLMGHHRRPDTGSRGNGERRAIQFRCFNINTPFHHGQVANRQTRRTVNPFLIGQWARHPPCPPI